MWIRKFKPSVIIVIILSYSIAFDAQSAPFSTNYFMDTSRAVDPVVWWKGLRRCKVPWAFADIAIHLLSSPSSSASVERVFSNFGLIHSKIRNRLGNEKASKLVFCYRMLRGATELDYN